MDETMIRRVYWLCRYMTGVEEDAQRLARMALRDPMPLRAAVQLLRRETPHPEKRLQGLPKALMAMPAQERLALLLADAAGAEPAQAAVWMDLAPQDFLALRSRARRRLLSSGGCASAWEKVQS